MECGMYLLNGLNHSEEASGDERLEEVQVKIGLYLFLPLFFSSNNSMNITN